MRNRIHVAVKGQLYENDLSECNYIFPKDNFDGSLTFASDTRITISALGLSGAGTECYTMAIVPDGVIYTYRRLMPTRGDCAMVMMMADGPTIDGMRLREKLMDILDYALKESSASKIDDEVISEKISNCATLFKSLMNNETETKEHTTTDKEAYRVYHSDEELFKILENPYQQDYSKYKCVHVVSSSTDVRPAVGSPLEFLDTPLETVFYFDLPKNVSVKDDLRFVRKDAPFILQYQKNGYKTFETLPQKASQHSKYFTIENESTIKVKRVEDCNIEFLRTIYISSVQAKTGDKIRGANTVYNSRVHSADENGTITIEMPDRKENLRISANGYGECKLDIDPAKCQNYEVKLESAGLSGKVYLIPAWAKKEKSTHTHIDEPCVVQYSKNSDIYKQYGSVLSKSNSGAHGEFYVSIKNPKQILTTACIVALIIGASVAFFTTSFVKNKQITNLTATIDSLEKRTVIDPTTVSQESPTTDTDSKSEIEKEDEQYLSEKDIWEYYMLQSEKYQEFYNLLIMKNCKTPEETNVLKYKAITPDKYPINNPTWKNIQEAISRGNGGDWSDAMKYRDQFRKCTGGMIDLKSITNPPKKTQQSIRDIPQG